MHNQIHICLICNEYPESNHGGIGSFTKDLAEGLAKNNFKVSIIGIYSKYVLDFNEEIIETINNVTVYRYPFENKFKDKRFNIAFNRYKLYKQIKNLNKINKINIIEAPEHDGWLPFGVPSKIPYISRLHSSVTLHGKLLNKKYSRLISILEKQQLKNSDYIISVSEYTAKTTFDLFNIKKEYKVIYNSIKIPSNIILEQIDKNLILFAGSVVPRKGVTELIKAINIVLKQFPNINLILAGKNQYMINRIKYEEYLRKFINDEFQNNVIFKGALDRDTELMPLINKAYFCCFPSHVEAFSLAPMEAMALGKAVIFTKYVSGPELIEDNISGLLADTKDPKDIADKILLLLNNEILCKQIAENGKKRIESNFSYQKWLTENISFYKEIINAK